jgi:hypothetical protein
LDVLKPGSGTKSWRRSGQPGRSTCRPCRLGIRGSISPAGPDDTSFRGGRSGGLGPGRRQWVFR